MDIYQWIGNEKGVPNRNTIDCEKKLFQSSVKDAVADGKLIHLVKHAVDTMV